MDRPIGGQSFSINKRQAEDMGKVVRSRMALQGPVNRDNRSYSL